MTKSAYFENPITFISEKITNSSKRCFHKDFKRGYPIPKNIRAYKAP